MNTNNFIIRDKISEADICFFLRKELDLLRFDIRQEVRILSEERRKQNSRKLIWRLDLVVNKKLWIEVKSKRKRKWLNKQIGKYEQYWFDMIECVGIKDIPNCINKVKEYFWIK